MSIDVPPRTEQTFSGQVGQEIGVVMYRRRISGRRLAAVLGVSQTWISSRLSGRTPIDLNDLQRIADALGVAAVELLPARTDDSLKKASGKPHAPKRRVGRTNGQRRRSASRRPADIRPTQRRPNLLRSPGQPIPV